MSGKFKLRQLNFAKRGDVIEAKLKDSAFNTYFKQKAQISNPKEMKELMEALKQKGVNFPA